MEVIIEIPKLEDLEQVNVLAKEVQELHVNWNPNLYLSVDEVINKEYFEEKIQSKEIFVAKLQDKIIGYIDFNIAEKDNPIMRHRKQLSIGAICIDELNRGKGIGTLLLQHVKNIAKENNCTDIDLTVNDKNENAIKVYESFGFKIKSISYSMQI